MATAEDFAAAQAGDIEIRNKILLEHQHVANSVASQRLRGKNEFRTRAELVSACQIPLIEAIAKFDPSLGFKFSTYARYRLQGALIDDLRATDHASRQSRIDQRTLASVTAQVSNDHHRGARHADFAAAGMSDSAIERATTGCAPIDSIQPMFDSGLSPRFDESVYSESPDPLGPEWEQVKRDLANNLAALPPQEQLINEMVWLTDLIQQEIAAILGVSNSAVSNRTKNTIRILRAAMTDSSAAPSIEQSLSDAQLTAYRRQHGLSLTALTAEQWLAHLQDVEVLGEILNGIVVQSHADSIAHSTSGKRTFAPAMLLEEAALVGLPV